MLDVKVKDQTLQFGESVTVCFMRTLRVPDDGRHYPLPPMLGEFPIFRVDDYADRVPASWREHGGVFIPMYQREAMWIDFTARWWKPNAVTIGVGKVNAVSGRPWCDGLSADPQNYIVVPDQPWLDGVNAGDGFIKQFIAMPLGMGYTIEGQLTGKEEFGGIQVMVFEPKPGRFPDKPPRPHSDSRMFCGIPTCSAPSEMGIGAGGRIRQKIYPDEHGLDTWDLSNHGRAYVHIVNSLSFWEITGTRPPSTPVTARYYTEAGLPWFHLYDEEEGDLPESHSLTQIKSVKEMDETKEFTHQQDDAPVDVPDYQVVKLKKGDPEAVRDGKW